MKFTRELPSNINLVRSYQADQVQIGEQILRSSCIVSADQLIVDWRPRTVTMLSATDFDAVLPWQPEIILLGTGAKQQFPAREIYAAILSQGIGFEVMDTGAVCRTYNVLVGESRRVAAALIF